MSLITCLALLLVALLGPPRLLALLELLLLDHTTSVHALTVFFVLLIQLSHVVILAELSEELVEVE